MSKFHIGDINFYPYSATLDVDLWYPRVDDPDRTPDHPVAVVVGLCDVRAADSIRIEYDFDRDGYVIKQATVFEWVNSDGACDPGWKEVAFIRAWQLKVDE